MKNLEKLKKIESMQNMLQSLWFCWRYIGYSSAISVLRYFPNCKAKNLARVLKLENLTLESGEIL